MSDATPNHCVLPMHRCWHLPNHEEPQFTFKEI